MRRRKNPNLARFMIISDMTAELERLLLISTYIVSFKPVYLRKLRAFLSLCNNLLLEAWQDIRSAHRAKSADILAKVTSEISGLADVSIFDIAKIKQRNLSSEYKSIRGVLNALDPNYEYKLTRPTGAALVELSDALNPFRHNGKCYQEMVTVWSILKFGDPCYLMEDCVL